MSWGAAHQVSLSITNFQSLLRLMFIKLVMPPINFIFCLPLYLLPSIFPSLRVFSNESALRIKWPRYWSFSFTISPSNEYSGLISFRVDWLDLLAVQRTLKSLLQHHSSKANCGQWYLKETLSDRSLLSWLGSINWAISCFALSLLHKMSTCQW